MLVPPTEVELPLARESAVFVWSDRALFIGDRSETEVHSHHAVECTVALDDKGIDMRQPNGSTHEGAGGVIVRAGAEHQLRVIGPKVAVLYVDPQSTLGEGLHRWLGEQYVAELPRSLLDRERPRLRQLLTDHEAGPALAARACQSIIDTLAPDAREPVVDKRVRQAIEIINERLGDPPSLNELAETVGLSGSRLRHMFAEQIGVPIRRYVLWMRLRAALQHALAGMPMTRAAHEAGFADAAHFTRTCKQMFGLPPTAFSPVDSVFVAS